MKDAPREFAKVISCDYCSRQGFPKLLRDDTFNLPQPGYIGSNYKNTGVLLVGQNPGVSPDRFSVQDRKFADAQIAVRDSANAASYGGMKNVLDGIMPTWPVVTKHFPLAECGLQLDDIAYVNVVRCRTHNNGTPGTKIIQACVSNHVCWGCTVSAITSSAGWTGSSLAWWCVLGSGPTARFSACLKTASQMDS